MRIFEEKMAQNDSENHKKSETFNAIFVKFSIGRELGC